MRPYAPLKQSETIVVSESQMMTDTLNNLLQRCFKVQACHLYKRHKKWLLIVLNLVNVLQTSLRSFEVISIVNADVVVSFQNKRYLFVFIVSSFQLKLLQSTRNRYRMLDFSIQRIQRFICSGDLFCCEVVIG